MKNQRRLIIGILFSVAFLYLAMRHIEWGELWALFREANYLYLIPAFFLLFSVSWVRAYRWRLLMYPESSVALGRMFNFVNIGYFFNNVFPAKAGELVRAYLAGQTISGGIGQALSSLLIERLLDVLCVVVLSVILLPFVSLPAWVMKGGILLGGGALLGALALVILSRFGERGIAWAWRFLGRVPVVGHERVRAVFQNLVRGFEVLTVWKLFPGIVLSSALV